MPHYNIYHMALQQSWLRNVPLIWLVQYSCSVVSNSLWPQGLQHSRPACPPPLQELAQTHVHWIGDAIQISHPLSSTSPAFNLSQNQGLFEWVSSSHQMAKVLEFQLQHRFFQWIFRNDLFQDWLVWSPYSWRDSQESSPTPQFKSISSLALSFLFSPAHIHTWLLEKP